ncbi:MAG: helix-turn-helix domain-containing protein [Azospirillaceae bacterium]|nr:helix-turn-helix domain-containing protein [Azospirillaceae bacterium]
MGEKQRRFFEQSRSTTDHGQVEPQLDRHDLPKGGVGATLRENREGRGLQLVQVARALRIRQTYLEAIEAGRFTDLPGTAYAIGFLRSYAEHLGLDPAVIVQRFKEEVSGGATKPEFYLPKPIPESRVPGGALLMLALVLGVCTYGAWYFMSRADRSLVAYVPALPDRLASLIHGTTVPPPVTVPVVPLAPEMADKPATAVPLPSTTVEPPPPAALAALPPPATPAPAATASATRHPAAATPPGSAGGDDEDEVPQVGGMNGEPMTGEGPTAIVPPQPPSPRPPGPSPIATAAAQAPTAPATPPTTSATSAEAATPPPAAAGDAGSTANSRVYGNNGRDSRIQFKATAESWVEIRDGNNEILFSRVLRPGEVYRVPDRSGIRLNTGNAGGLEVTVDGNKVAAIGNRGQVMRNVPLDASKMAGTAN